MDYTKDIEIDESALDVEWLNQPALAMKYGKNLAEKERELSNLEEEFKLKEADLREMINNNPNKYIGVDVKVTVANVQAALDKQEDYQELKNEIVDLKYEVKIAKIAYEQINTSRKAALENLVKLHGLNYFAGPSVPRDLSHEAQQTHKQNNSNANVAGKMKRTKK